MHFCMEFLNEIKNKEKKFIKNGENYYHVPTVKII